MTANQPSQGPTEAASGQGRGPARDRRPLILAACMLAMFMAAIEATIVATAIPSIVADLGGFALFGWVFGAYMLAQSVTIPIYGRLADLYGRKRMLFIGTALFLAGSTLCGLAPSMPALIVFRALQGLGAGAIVPIASTIVGDIYAPAERARIQGWLSSVWGISAITGPLLGALIVEHLSWSVIFWINLPFGAATIAALALFYPEKPAFRRHASDFPGAVLMVITVGSLMLALLQFQSLGWWSLALLALSAAACAGLIIQERTARDPLLPLALFNTPMIRAGTIGSAAIGAAMMGCSAFLPIYIQGVLGRSVLAGGTALALMSISWPIASTLGGRLMLVTSYRFNVVLGGAILLAGSLLMPLMLQAGSLPGANLASFIIGAGLGLCSSTWMVAVQGAAAQHQRGIATAATVFARQAGAAIGTALLGAVLNLRLGHALSGDPVQTLMDPAARATLPPPALSALSTAVQSALHAVFWATAALSLLAALVTLMTPGRLRPGSPLPPRSGA